MSSIPLVFLDKRNCCVEEFQNCYLLPTDRLFSLKSGFSLSGLTCCDLLISTNINFSYLSYPPPPPPFSNGENLMLCVAFNPKEWPRSYYLSQSALVQRLRREPPDDILVKGRRGGVAPWALGENPTSLP